MSSPFSFLSGNSSMLPQGGFKAYALTQGQNHLHMHQNGDSTTSDRQAMLFGTTVKHAGSIPRQLYTGTPASNFTVGNRHGDDIHFYEEVLRRPQGNSG